MQTPVIEPEPVAMQPAVAVTTTRSGRQVKAPQRYEPQEVPVDDYTDSEYDSEAALSEDDDDISSEATSSDESEEEEDSDLEGFIVDDDEVDEPEESEIEEPEVEDGLSSSEEDDLDDDMEGLLPDSDSDTGMDLDP